MAAEGNVSPQRGPPESPTFTGWRLQRRAPPDYLAERFPDLMIATTVKAMSISINAKTSYSRHRAPHLSGRTMAPLFWDTE